MAKAVGSGSGAVGSALTVVGGSLILTSTIWTAGGTAFTVLLAGTSLGLASGLAGGAATITESVIKSKQVALAQRAIEKDKVLLCPC